MVGANCPSSGDAWDAQGGQAGSAVPYSATEEVEPASYLVSVSSMRKFRVRVPYLLPFFGDGV